MLVVAVVEHIMVEQQAQVVLEVEQTEVTTTQHQLLQPVIPAAAAAERVALLAVPLVLADLVVPISSSSPILHKYLKNSNEYCKC
jgi:hypothetical protein